MTLMQSNVPPFSKAPSDEEELPMPEVVSHVNDKLMVQPIPENVNGGVINDVRIKRS